MRAEYVRRLRTFDSSLLAQRPLSSDGDRRGTKAASSGPPLDSGGHVLDPHPPTPRGPAGTPDGAGVRRPEDSLAAVSTLQRLLLVDMQLSPAMLVEDAAPNRYQSRIRRSDPPAAARSVGFLCCRLARANPRRTSLVDGTVNRVLPPVLPPPCPNGSKRLEHTSDTTPICVDYNAALERPGCPRARRSRQPRACCRGSVRQWCGQGVDRRGPCRCARPVGVRPGRGSRRQGLQPSRWRC